MEALGKPAEYSETPEPRTRISSIGRKPVPMVTVALIGLLPTFSVKSGSRNALLTEQKVESRSSVRLIEWKIEPTLL